MTPKYLQDNLPPLRRFLYGEDNPHVLRNIFCNTKRYMNSFFPDSIKIWNNLGKDFQPCNSPFIFKKQIINIIRPTPKSTFDIYDPIGLKYLHQLRLSLSPLRSHKMNHSFADTLNVMVVMVLLKTLVIFSIVPCMPNID